MAGSASHQKAMGGISPARPTSPRQKARITTSELRRRGNSELASAQLPPYQSPTGWICDQTLSVARRYILTFAQNTRFLLCARSRRSRRAAHIPARHDNLCYRARDARGTEARGRNHVLAIDFSNGFVPRQPGGFAPITDILRSHRFCSKVPSRKCCFQTAKQHSRPKAPPKSNLMIVDQVATNGSFDFRQNRRQ